MKFNTVDELFSVVDAVSEIRLIMLSDLPSYSIGSMICIDYYLNYDRKLFYIVKEYLRQATGTKRVHNKTILDTLENIHNDPNEDFSIFGLKDMETEGTKWKTTD